MTDGKGKYEDIINLPHKQSEIRPRMSMRNRAAQFASFDALESFGKAVNDLTATDNDALSGEHYEPYDGPC